MQMHRVRLGAGVLDHKAESLIRAIVVDVPQGIEVKFAFVNVEHW